MKNIIYIEVILAIIMMILKLKEKEIQKLNF